ncbi:MAG: hypothetical protein ACTH0V_00355 [Microbacteriaceae bacterium]
MIHADKLDARRAQAEATAELAREQQAFVRILERAGAGGDVPVDDETVADLATLGFGDLHDADAVQVTRSAGPGQAVTITLLYANSDWAATDDPFAEY